MFWNKKRGATENPDTFKVGCVGAVEGVVVVAVVVGEWGSLKKNNGVGEVSLEFCRG